jgi:hypothetical protein
MTKLRDQVAEFSRAFGVPMRDRPGIPDDDTVKLRLIDRDLEPAH